jgi:hypothetical protein
MLSRQLRRIITSSRSHCGATGDGDFRAFFNDAAIQTRLLFAAPMLIVAETVGGRELSKIANRFYDPTLLPGAV